MAGIFSVNRNVNDRPDFVARLPARADLVHKFFVADANDLPVDFGANASTRNFFDGFNRAIVALVGVGLAQRICYRVRRISFDVRGQVQKFFLVEVQIFAVHGVDLEAAFGERAGFVHDDRLNFRERLQKI